jgi:acyl-coenzyme A synthetase/AMP-(fatty) acid ligase/acyl carrier protein
MGESLRLPENLPEEQQAIRAKCFHPSGTFVEFGRDEIEQSIPDRFEKVVRRYYDRLAVQVGDDALTYDFVDKAANRIGRAVLDKLGEKIEPIVLLSDQGFTTISSYLGILKAGKISVAVDPSFPLEWIAHIIDDCQAGLILTGNKNLSLATALAKASRQIINVEALGENVSDEKIGLPIGPDHIAEIRYTSGSTGRPKGIVRSHRRNLHSAMLTINTAHVCSEDRVLILRNLSYGSRDILKGLLAGAALFPFDIKKDGLSGLAAYINQQKITCYAAVASTFRYFINEVGAKEIFPSVRLIQLGGEPLSKREVDAYKEHFSDGCILMNRLSCGEAGNLCRYFIDKQTEISTPIVPVGYPVEGKEIFLLDNNRNKVEGDQVGEIAVRSRYLSTEYWRRPELTSAKFLSDPSDEGKRLYLTGDLGRMLPDGCIVYLGRKDFEVKIRGAKVAIPEIEIALRECPSVKDAAVVAARRDRSGEQQLVAYLVPATRPVPTVSALRGFLKTKLPVYMIPASFVVVDEIPLTVTGKVDRRALPEPGGDRPELETPYCPSRTPVEKKVARIWAEVLSLDRVGIHDDFFELGGHSLAATRVVSRVINTFQLELPHQSLFQTPTVAEMAEVILQSRTRKLGEQELDRLLTEVESLSDEEAGRLLPKKTSGDK